VPLGSPKVAFLHLDPAVLVDVVVVVVAAVVVVVASCPWATRGPP